MNLKLFLLLTFSIFLSTCSDKSTENLIDQQTTPKNVLTEKAINKLNFRDFGLSDKAEKVVESWVKYNELKIQLDYLRKADVSFFKSETKELQDFIIAFKEEIPEDINSDPIVSRAIVLETKLMLLHQTLLKENTATKNQLKGIKALLVAFSNLNFQIDKQLERNFYDQIQPES